MDPAKMTRMFLNAMRTKCKGKAMPEYLWKRAKKEKGTTRNPREAGYVLPDGTMLNFSGGERGHRYEDHREIFDAYNGDPCLETVMYHFKSTLGPEVGSNAAWMLHFMNLGAMRVFFSTPRDSLGTYFKTLWVNVHHAPTPEQENAIKGIVRAFPGTSIVYEVDDVNDRNKLLQGELDNATPRDVASLFTGMRNICPNGPCK